MSHRPAERMKVYNEILTITSAAGATSQRYSMSDCYKITFITGMGTAAASTATTPTLTVRQAVDEAAATSTTITGATGTLGASTANAIQGAKVGLITFTTATTGAETVTINGYTLTQSTAGASTIATALTFGSSLGATVAGGLDGAVNSLSSVINASTLGYWFTATTISTVAASISVNDTAASTGLTMATTGTNIAPSYVQSQSVIEVLAEDLNATSQYVYLQISSADTSVQCGVCVVKDGLRQLPPIQVGQHVKST